MTALANSAAPPFDEDFYGEAFIRDPYPRYAAMRALGPVVRLTRHGNWAVTRFREAREVLRDWRTYSSAHGVAADDAGCDFLKGNTLASDPPRHDEMRVAMAQPLLPGPLESIRGMVEEAATQLVDDLLARSSFDGMADLARHLPLTVVTELVGLPVDGRENMLNWAAASFDILGVQNERGRRGVETVREMRHWITTRATKERLKPGSWTARIHDLVADGTIEADVCPYLIRDYINPSLDTTISATGQLIHQLGRNPEQWRLLRENPELIPNAVHEAVRLGAPIRSFSRTVVRGTTLAGIDLSPGDRVMVLFASANRDETKFPDPDRFDVTRTEHDHLGFGHGLHMCVGMHLARLEMESLLRAMVERVGTIEVGEPSIALNNTIHAFADLPVTLTAGPRRTVTTRPKAASASGRAWIDAKVVRVGERADRILSFELASAAGEALPAFSAGSHLDVEIEPGLVRQYSLCGDPALSGRYRLAVQEALDSRGGSRGIHRRIETGTTLRIGAPRNHFTLAEDATRTFLFAGGVGITPIVAMAYRLRARGAAFELSYSVQSRGSAIFLDELATLGGDRFALHVSDEGTRLDAARAFPAPEAGLHAYICGPERYITALSEAAVASGWSQDRLHVEHFGGGVISAGEPFTVVAARSGTTVEVAADATILSALREVGIDIPTSCESGVCATCLTDVLEGEPDHRDLVQTPAEKAGNARIAVCCSRALSRRLVLDV